MKKIYSLALAVAAGAMAVNAQVPQQAAQLNLEEATEATVAASAPGNLLLAPQKAEGATSVFAKYVYCCKNFLSGKNGNGKQRQVTVAQGEGNAVTLTGFNGEWMVNGVYNAQDETIHIQRQAVATNQENGKTLVAVMEIFDWSGNNPVATKDEIVLKYKGGVLSLPDQFTVIGLGAHENTIDGNLAGYYLLAGGNFFLDAATQFNSIGSTSFINNFFNPMFGVVGKAANVTVYKSTTNSGIFLVENAFTAINAQATKGQMIIDATNPQYVRVPVQNSGVEATDRGNTWYCSLSAATPNLTDFNATISELGGGGITSTGDKIEFTKNSCRFNWDAYANNDGNWFYNSKTTACTLNLPGEAGVNDLVVDDENAPVEYFNLQGVKIQNPAEGQIVIRRQGTKVAKVVM